MIDEKEYLLRIKPNTDYAANYVPKSPLTRVSEITLKVTEEIAEIGSDNCVGKTLLRIAGELSDLIRSICQEGPTDSSGHSNSSHTQDTGRC